MRSSSAYDDAEYDDDDSGIQVMITNKMRRALEDDLGYLADEVDSMEPSIAAVVIERRLIRPSNGMPLSWQRPPAARGGGRGGGVLGRARLALSRLKTKMEESVGLFVSITLIALSAGAAHQLISSGVKLPGLPWLRQVISSVGGKVGGLVSCVFSLGVGVAKSAKTAAAAAASAGLSGLSARTGVGRGGGEGRRDFPSPSHSAADTSAASGSKSSRQLQLQLQLKAKANAEAKAKAKAKAKAEAEAIKQEDKGNAKTKAKSKEDRKKFLFEPKSKSKTKAMTASKAPTATGGTTQSSRSSSFFPLSLAPRWAKRGLGGGDNGGSGSTTSSVSGSSAGMRGERERLTERFSDDETETERRKRGGGFRFGWGWGKGRGRGGEQDKDKDKDISAKHKLFTRPPAALPKPSSKANTARAPSRGQAEGSSGSSGSRGSSGSTSSSVSVSTSGSGSSDYPIISFGSSSSSPGSSSGSSGSSSSGAGIKSTVGSVDLASMHDITRVSPLEAIRLWLTTNKMNRAVGGKGGAGAGAGAGAGGFDDHSSSAGTKRR